MSIYIVAIDFKIPQFIKLESSVHKSLAPKVEEQLGFE